MHSGTDKIGNGDKPTDKYTALRAAAEAVKETGHIARYTKAYVARQDFREVATHEIILDLLADRDADRARIAELEYELGRYSMSAGEADQRRCESRAARDALGFGKDADDVSPSDLRQRIAELEARTLTVKLPPEVQGSNIPFAADGANAMRKEVVKALTEACAAHSTCLKIEGE